MSFNRMNLIAATDISSSPKIFKKFRGKAAKEVYRCVKGFACTGSLRKPLIFATGQLSKEFTTGFVVSCGGSAVESLLGYVSGIGFVRWIYKASDVKKIKAIARLGYNILGLPITMYSKGVCTVTDLLQIGYLEKKWFGEQVYIFDDNRIWLEKQRRALVQVWIFLKKLCYILVKRPSGIFCDL